MLKLFYISSLSSHFLASQVLLFEAGFFFFQTLSPLALVYSMTLLLYKIMSTDIFLLSCLLTILYNMVIFPHLIFQPLSIFWMCFCMIVMWSMNIYGKSWVSAKEKVIWAITSCWTFDTAWINLLTWWHQLLSYCSHRHFSLLMLGWFIRSTCLFVCAWYGAVKFFYATSFGSCQDSSLLNSLPLSIINFSGTQKSIRKLLHNFRKTFYTCWFSTLVYCWIFLDKAC